MGRNVTLAGGGGGGSAATNGRPDWCEPPLETPWVTMGWLELRVIFTKVLLDILKLFRASIS